MLNAIGLAAITIGSDGQLEQANSGAEAVLKRGDGLTLRQGFITCANPSLAKNLSHVIAAATARAQPSAGAILLERTGGLAAYQVTITPLPGMKALILFRDPDMQDTSVSERLRALFGLTIAEADLAIALSHGASLTEIAGQRTVRESTVRSQIKSIAAKMHCSRQAEISAIVARLPPLHPQKS